ncbi:MAG TPA: ABC transporter ATP-binding protein [Candidatus Saccharimonadales bacterium]|nr:ABC transporter ATP-binding protein [Candidatus Saccharimonadales bacterium]
MDAHLPAITVRNLRKEFVLPQHRRTSLKQAFVGLTRKNTKTQQKVLDGISFEIQRGEFFGIVGRNGSGKSTLLKILAGVYHPNAGSVDINGELTPFIELGVGFNPELSGRDNVFLNGALLGFTRKEMESMYDEIVAFAELEQFMDQKLKNYSSGMQVRLAFSIAIKAHNDILIFDEVLAVGDEAFQRKCLDVFEYYKAHKQTVILVTHDMETVRQFCSRAMLLDKGKIIEIGNPRKVAAAYSDLNQQSIDQAVAAQNDTGQKPSFLKAQVLGSEMKPKVNFRVGETLTARVRWIGLEDMKSLGINIFKESGEHVTGINTLKDGVTGWQESKELLLDIDLDITTGKYHLLIEAFREEGEVIDAILEGPRFTVTNPHAPQWSGLCSLPHKWRVPEKA